MDITYNKLILLLIVLIIIYFISNFNNIKETLKNTLYFDNDANYQYITDLDKKQCLNYDCQNDNKETSDIFYIANDADKKQIFKFKNSLYKLENDKLIIANDEVKDLKYLEMPIKLPMDSNKMTLKVKLTFKDYEYVGLLNNNYYNQEYILYEKPYDRNGDLDNKLYQYILVKILEGVYTVMYELPPRQKILPNEYIWASYGSFQIGPLIFN
uniref:Uncharacterized protein n=1 Tax=viral metagenome TaxID=1070528 RepID=A0A6C0DA58_9ZZZZ